MGKASKAFTITRRAIPQDAGDAYNKISKIKKHRGLASANSQKNLARAMAKEADKFTAAAKRK